MGTPTNDELTALLSLVRITPGARQLTRIFFVAHSGVKPLHRATNAVFVTPYKARC